MAQQVVEMTGDEARLLKSVQRLNAKEAEHERQLLATSKAGDKVDRSLSGAARNSAKNASKGSKAFKSFGKSAVADLKSIALGYVGVSKGIEQIIDLNVRVAATNKEAFGSIKGTRDSDRRLIQIARDSKDFQELRGKADSLSEDFGLDRNAARELVFSARSGDFEGALDFIASNESVIDTEEQARVATKLPKLFAKSGLTPQQAINATLAGARESELDFSQISRSLPQAAEGGRIVGASPAELISTQSVLSSLFKSQDTSADRIKLLATKIGLDERTSGKGLLGGISALQSLPEADRKEFLGDSQELNTAFRALVESLDAIKNQIPKVQAAIDNTGTKSSITAKRRLIAASDPKLSTELAARKAELGLEISRENRRGVSEGERQTFVDRGLTAAERDGASPTSIAFAEKVSNSAATFGFNEGSAGAIPLLTGNSIANFERDLGFAFQQGDGDAPAALRAASELRQTRALDPNALLPKNEVAAFISNTTGANIPASEVSDAIQRRFTRGLVEGANASGGSASTFGAALPGVGALVQSSAGGAASDRVDELVDLMREMVAEQQQNNVSAQRTAANTKSRISSNDIVREARR